jgi:hypothetical protein
MEEKLKGIRLIGIADLILGFCSLVFLLYSAISWIVEFKRNSLDTNISSFVVFILISLVSILLIKLGRLTIRLNPQAVRGNIIFAVFVIMEFLGSQLQHQDRVSGLIRCALLIYSIWMIFYLCRRKVRDQFKQS